MLLLGLEVAPPEAVEVVLAIDVSDSCGDLSKVFAYAKKQLKQLPSNWPLKIFSLSSPQAISRCGLRLLDLIEAESWLNELCVDTSFLSIGKRLGSFLRPVLETLTVAKSFDRQLLIVLTDGRFSDFGVLEVPASLEIVCIVPNAAHTLTALRRGILRQGKILNMHDVQLDKIIASYANPFFGPVVIQPKVDASMLDRFYRVDIEGRIIDWQSMPNHIVNLASGRQFLLFDGTVEDAQSIRWQIKSCSNETIKILQGSKAALQPHPILEKKIIQHLTQADSKSTNEVICWLQSGDDRFISLAEQFKQANNLATQGKGWIDDDGKMQVFYDLEDIKAVSDNYRRQHHAILAIMVQCRQTGSPLQIGLFSLSRDMRPSLQFHPESPSSQLVAAQHISIGFDESRYRWILNTHEPNDGMSIKATELEYYASEKLVLPLSHPSGVITVLFSGNIS